MDRVYFRLCTGFGRLLRAARYSDVRIVSEHRQSRVRKRRAFFAPFLVWLGGPLVRILDTGMRVLPRHDWQARERQLYQTLYGTSIGIEADGTLVLPRLAGETLATLLEDSALGDSDRWKAIELTVLALAELHARGSTHGDAMAENVMVDLDGDVARWFDFETVHDPSRPVAWRRADDVRAFLASCLVRTAPFHVAGTLRLILDTYGDEGVTRLLARSFGSVWRRALPFHLGQAPLAFQLFREIGRLLKERLGE